MRAERWEKGRAVCKLAKSVIITASAQKAASQLAEMVLISLNPDTECVCVGAARAFAGVAREKRKVQNSARVRLQHMSV